MRAIKFRAWEPLKNGSQMIYDITLGSRNCPSNIFNIWKVMRFTGLTDKNGKEIYEGDIVRDRFGRIMQVMWFNYRLCWVAITDTNFHHADLFDWVERDEQGELTGVARVEVIGNVYETPHLLNSKQNPKTCDATEAPTELPKAD